MRLTKHIKLTRGRARLGARWMPLGYYRNRNMFANNYPHVTIIDSLVPYITHTL